MQGTFYITAVLNFGPCVPIWANIELDRVIFTFLVRLTSLKSIQRFCSFNIDIDKMQFSSYAASLRSATNDGIPLDLEYKYTI